MPVIEDRPLFIYTGVIKGKFVVKAADDDENPAIKERENAEEKIVREYHYKGYSDLILVDVKDSFHEKYKWSWEFIFLDGNQYRNWKVSKKSSVAAIFLKRLENLQLDQPLSLSSGYDEKDDKSFITVWQDGIPVASKYPKPKEGEPPSDLPQPIYNESTGEWDWTKQLIYFKKIVTEIRPFLPGVNAEAHQVAQEQAQPSPEGVNTETGEVKEQKEQAPPPEPPPADDEIDDLPF